MCATGFARFPPLKHQQGYGHYTAHNKKKSNKLIRRNEKCEMMGEIEKILKVKDVEPRACL